MQPKAKTVCKPLTESEYEKAFETFQRSATSYGTMQMLFDPVIKEFANKPVDLLSIGAGTGCFEDSLIKQNAFLINYYYGIEPNDYRRAQLQETVETWNTTYFIDSACFDENFKVERKFDLILMIHVMYHFEDPVEMIKKAKLLLKPNGKVVVFHGGRRGFLGIRDEWKENIIFSPALNEDPYLMMEDVSEGLRKNGVYNVMKEAQYSIDVSEFINREATPSANHLASFLLWTLYEDLPSNLQHWAYEAIKAICKEEAGGRFFASATDTIIWIKNE